MNSPIRIEGAESRMSETKRTALPNFDPARIRPGRCRPAGRSACRSRCAIATWIRLPTIACSSPPFGRPGRRRVGWNRREDAQVHRLKAAPEQRRRIEARKNSPISVAPAQHDQLVHRLRRRPSARATAMSLRGPGTAPAVVVLMGLRPSAAERSSQREVASTTKEMTNSRKPSAKQRRQLQAARQALRELHRDDRGDGVARSNSEVAMRLALPMTKVTAMVSPSARPRPSMMPPTTEMRV
jgi:hypothetical protein